MQLQQLVRLIALFLTGLYAGAAMYSLVGVAPAMKIMQSLTYAEFHQKLDLFMGVRMAFYAKITLAVNLLLLIVTVRSAGRMILILTIAGFLFFFTEIFFTVSVNVPLNEEVQTWDIHHLPQHWASVRDKWIRFDIVRTWCAMISFFIYLIAFTLSTKRT